MLSNCLIFLLTGAFVTCRPTTSKHPVKELSQLNVEIQNHLDTIIVELEKQSPVKVQNLNTTTLRIPVSTTEKQCARFMLRTFIKLLDPVEIEGLKELDRSYHKLLRKLKEFERLWSPEKKENDQKCETKEYTHHKLIRVLDDLKWLMKDLYCIQGNCDK